VKLKQPLEGPARKERRRRKLRFWQLRLPLLKLGGVRKKQCR
jgi:hypothetical protein